MLPKLSLTLLFLCVVLLLAVAGLYWISTYEIAVTYVIANPPPADDGGFPPIPAFAILLTVSQYS